MIAGVLWDVWRRYRQDKKFKKQMEDLSEGQNKATGHKLSQLSVDHFEKTIYTQRLASHPAAVSTHATAASTQSASRSPVSQRQASRVEPTLAMGASPAASAPSPAAKVDESAKPDVAAYTALETQVEPESEPAPIPKRQTTFMISVIARDPQGFAGAQLLYALEAANMHYGRMNIFHRTTDTNGLGDVLFSACRVNEPGYFSYASLPDQHIPGITLFFVAEEVAEPLKTLNSMVGTAKQISYNLNGDLRDHAHQPLTIHTIEKYKRQVAHLAKQEKILDMVE